VAGKIIADIIEAPYNKITLNVGNTVVATMNASGLYTSTGNLLITQANQLGRAALPAGSVLQTLQTSSTSRVQVSTSSYTDINPSLSITPTSSSSKILIIASYSIGGYSSTNIVEGDVQLLRGASSIIEYVSCYANQAAVGLASELRSSGQYSFVYLDSPATTSSTTYKFQMKCTNGSRVESPSNNGTSQNILTLLEIAA
jgi:hypothetical protein